MKSSNRVATGVIAAGHPKTAEAAEITLRAGGNAFDAVVAGFFAACVCEPVLASLGGGGFLLARPAAAEPLLYDFFAHTPGRSRAPEGLDFHPIVADFGTTTQEFHIGLGSIAVPGNVAGMFAIHRDLGRMPLTEVVEPAVSFARQGVAMNSLQSYIFDVVGAIYLASAASRALFCRADEPDRLIGEGELLHMRQFADFTEVLAREGEGLFYRGEIAERIAADHAAGGGHLSARDLAQYRVGRRAPLESDYRGLRILTNPPPSSGGLLIAFALRLLEHEGARGASFGSLDHLLGIAEAMRLTNKARLDARLQELPFEQHEARVLGHEFVERYRAQVATRTSSTRGTTHISVVDRAGDVASMTVSNGEGSSYVVPGTGVMLNNMLGEEDLNPEGFHRWRPGERISSMMAPTLLIDPAGTLTACGSGGSNRIRTAILQFLLNRVDFGMSLEQAVVSPRIHHEGALLSLEPGFDEAVMDALRERFPEQHRWQEPNLFFGGVHAASLESGGRRLDAVGDPRRGGVHRIVA